MAKTPDIKKLWLLVDEADQRAVIIGADNRDDVLAKYATLFDVELEELKADADHMMGIHINNLSESVKEAAEAVRRNGSKALIVEIVAW